MADQELIQGVETRSRSRSKTPSRVMETRQGTKIPNVQTIEEEEISIVATPVLRTSTRIKDVVKDNRAVESTVTTGNKRVTEETLVTSTTTVVTSTAKKETNNKVDTAKKTATKSSSSRKSKEMSDNDKNALLETSIEAIRKSTSSENLSNGNGTGNNIAYLVYKEAGEYWNKFPKTDYTYSELSPHRRELAPGQVIMPNMSRGSLDKHHARIENMIQKSPEQAAYIRERYLSRTTRTTSVRPKLQYDSGDELDYSEYETRRQPVTNYQYTTTTVTTRFKRAVTTFITTIFTYFTSLFHLSRTNNLNRTESLYYTRFEEKKSFFSRFVSLLTTLWLAVLRRFYITVSSILTIDTWLLMSRSSSMMGQRKRRFLLLLLLLLPLLLFGALLTSDYNQKISQYIALPVASVPAISAQPLITYFSSFKRPNWSFTLPSINFGLPWFSRSTDNLDSLKTNGLDEASIQRILNHIDAYIEKIIAAKLKSSQDETIAMFLRNQDLVVLIRNIVKENIVYQNYVLTDADVERVAIRVREYLAVHLAETKHELSRDSAAEIKKVVAGLSLATAGTTKQGRQSEDVDINQVTLQVLDSPKFTEFLANYLKVPDSDIEQLRVELDDLRGQFKATNVNVEELQLDLAKIRDGYDALAALIAQQGSEQDDKLTQLLNELNIRINKLEESPDNLIDERVRKILVTVLGGDGSMSIDSLAIYVRSVFVTRDYLEDRLQRLNLERDAKVKEDLDKLAALLLNQIMSKVHEQIIDVKSTQQVNIANFDDEYIRKIVKEILAVYDADKTALPDYALETAGGQVISIKCTQVYQHKSAQISIFGIPLWYQTSTPRVVITPSVHPGQCWAFAGFPGYLVIQLSRLIHVTGFTVEHIPKTLAPNGKIESAPKNFVVSGLLHENDKSPVRFGSYEFREDGEPLQYFKVQNETILQPHQFVEMRIDSNHGHQNYTCLYRFRVHGLPVE